MNLDGGCNHLLIFAGEFLIYKKQIFIAKRILMKFRKLWSEIFSSFSSLKSFIKFKLQY